jgi:hypothetical protein
MQNLYILPNVLLSNFPQGIKKIRAKFNQDNTLLIRIRTRYLKNETRKRHFMTDGSVLVVG